VRCSGCGTDNQAGRKFCAQCGARLAVACPACGTANLPGDRFCGECGTRLDAEAPGRPAGPAPIPVATGREEETPAAERRLVSVLFADLVGFTALAASRDPEEVREFLARYFDLARGVVGRYGGTVEKFIGDAVMAVWGAHLVGLGADAFAQRVERSLLQVPASAAG
jgi:class 3 adenylate cyclase